MTGFSGRVLLEGDKGGAEELLPKALKVADQLHAWKTHQNIPAVTKAFDLGDGSYCVVADLQQIRSLLVVCPPTSQTETTLPEFPLEVSPTTGVIDVVSGVVTSPTLVEEEILASQITPGKKGKVKKLLLNGFTPCEYTTARYTNIQRRYRLGIKEDPAFSSMSALNEVIYSEHAHTLPSQYSGAMRRVVQLVLGIGRLVRPTWEETQIKNKTIDGLLSVSETDPKTSAFGLYGEKMDGEVVLKWDYRFARTHGISFDADRKPWVIEISTRGVYAMRLFLDPVSTTEEGKKRYKEVSPELSDFIDEFGGIPIGTGFPVSSDFENYKKAGEIVELLTAAQMSGFYSKSMFSSDIGWSFNERGTEAHNCAVGVDQAKSTGNHYRVRISLGREAAFKVTASKRAVISELALTKTWQINKAYRLADEVAVSILKTINRDGVKVAMQEFLAISVTPSMSGIASLQLMRSGFLYHGARPKGQPQIKFPESLVGGLISFDFGPYETNARIDYCDAPMFVCFIEDSLEIVSYHYDVRARQSIPAENTREACQFTGGWTSSAAQTAPIMMGNFYSNRWDWRTEISQEGSVTTRSGNKLGVEGWAVLQDFNSQCINVGSSTYFGITSRTEAYSSRSLGVAVAIPFHIRDCYYMIRHDSVYSHPAISGMSIESTPGPDTQYWRIYNFIFHWNGRCGYNGNISVGTIGGTAKKLGQYTGQSCVADGIPGGGISYTVEPMFPTPGIPLTVSAPQWEDKILLSATWPKFKFPSTYSVIEGEFLSKHSYEIWMVCNSDRGSILVKKGSVASPNATIYDLDMSTWWFKFSPDPDSGVMPWMGATQSCLGDTIVNYHDDMDGYVTAHYGGSSAMHTGVLNCYTGVIE